jgi:argininosuccinate synthase
LNRIAVACTGDEQSLATITELSRTAEVVAVALDFGAALPLNAIREAALAAGATRCHAFDVREEFTRDYVLPALRSRLFDDPLSVLNALAPDVATRKLTEVAQLEDAAVLSPAIVTVAARPLPRRVAAPLHLDITFSEGLPISVNGVEMTLTELMESIETITGESALRVLDREMMRASAAQVA